ncbi:MAG TPA: GFA family protein [Sphingomicrobium sp.]|nr:GFA family protein [Sphingomicrobium sp.]
MSVSPDVAEGGCLCGAIRYRVRGAPVATTLCHCCSCRRASGGTNVAWAVFDAGAFQWLSGYPGHYSSTPGLEWLFCRDCGSLLAYRRASRTGHMDITIGTLDDPNLFPPTVEIWLEHRIAWETSNPRLPKRDRSSLNTD